jgi:hypothetical protein
MKKPSIYQIKAGVSGHYFERKTLKFFGQTLKSFSVYKTDKPGVYRTAAPMVCRGRNVGISSAFWKDEGGGLFTKVNEEAK